MKLFSLALSLVLFASLCLAGEPVPLNLGATVQQKIKEGLILDDATTDYEGLGKGPKTRFLLVGYAEEAQVADGDNISFRAVEDGLLKWGSETLHKYHVVEKPKK